MKRSTILIISFILIVLSSIISYYFFATLDSFKNESTFKMDSKNMEHNSNFDTWWGEQLVEYKKWNITKANFQSYSEPDGIKEGSILKFKDVDFLDVEVGDIVLIKNEGGIPWVSRVVNKTNNSITTKGDNNFMPSKGERDMNKSRFIGILHEVI